MENSGYDYLQHAYQLKSESLPEEAKAIVKNITAYEEIWGRLDDEYGNFGELVAVVLKDKSNLKIIEEEDDKGLINVVDKIEQGYQDLKCIGKEAQLANVITIKTIESKLPRVILREWWKHSEEYEEENIDDCMGKLKELVEFLCGERAKARRSLRVEADRRPKYKKESYMLDIKPAMRVDTCWMKGCTDDHKVRQCPRFKALSSEKKGEMVLQMKACVLFWTTYSRGLPHAAVLAAV